MKKVNKEYKTWGAAAVGKLCNETFFQHLHEMDTSKPLMSYRLEICDEIIWGAR